MKDTITDKILSFLKNNPRYSYNAKTIHRYLRGMANLTTIRSILRRLDERGIIWREQRGFYRIKLDSETLYYLENPPTLLHGIMISMEKLQKCIDTIPAHNGKLFDDLDRFGFELRGNNKFVKKFFYLDDVERLVTFTFHPSVCRLDWYFNCSNHPLNYFEFRDLLSYCEAKVDFLGPFMNRRIVSFGEGKDFRRVHMVGCSELSLRAYMNHWFRVYNKERLGVTRVEQHISCNVPVKSFLEMFEGMFFPQVNGNGKPDEKRDVV